MRAFAVQQVEDLAARHFSQAKGQAVTTACASHQGPLLHSQGLPAAWQDWQARARRQGATTSRTTASAATAHEVQPLQPWQQAVTQAVLQLEGQMLQGFLQLMSGAQPARGEARLAAASPTRAAGLKPWPSARQASPEDLAEELTGEGAICQANACACAVMLLALSATLGAVCQVDSVDWARQGPDVPTSTTAGLMTHG